MANDQGVKGKGGKGSGKGGKGGKGKGSKGPDAAARAVHAAAIAQADLDKKTAEVKKDGDIAVAEASRAKAVADANAVFEEAKKTAESEWSAVLEHYKAAKQAADDVLNPPTTNAPTDGAAAVGGEDAAA